MNWNIRYGYQIRKPDRDHPTITEITTGIVACGDSWCTGECNLPALVLHHEDQEYRAFGCMVAYGPVFQPFRRPWKGEKISVTLMDTPIEQAIKMYWR